MKKPRPQKIFDDPIVAEVRKAGDEMAHEADYDLHTLCERLRQAERTHLDRIVKTPPPPKLGK